MSNEVENELLNSTKKLDIFGDEIEDDGGVFDPVKATERINISSEELYSMVKRNSPEIAEAMLKEVERANRKNE